MLFGHQNDDTQQTQVAPAPQDVAAGINPLALDPATGASLPTVPQPQPLSLDEASVLNQPTTPSFSDTATTAPLIDTPVPLPPIAEPLALDSTSVPAPADPPVADIPSPFVSDNTSADTPTATEEPATDPSNPTADALLALKQQALAQLSPLVGQLDQTPEEKFRTTMMMIQSTDNQSLIPTAYEAAQAITDEKVRAQALLDVINEINYFTQPKSAE